MERRTVVREAVRAQVDSRSGSEASHHTAVFPGLQSTLGNRRFARLFTRANGEPADPARGEAIRRVAHEGVHSADQPFPHLHLLRRHLGPAQHERLAMTRAAIGGPARGAAETMSRGLGGKVAGWTLGGKVGFPDYPSLTVAMHEGAHLLGGDEALATRAATAVGRGQRAEHLLPNGAGPPVRWSVPQFCVLSAREEADLSEMWVHHGLTNETLCDALEQNRESPTRWPTPTSFEEHLGFLLEITKWLASTSLGEGGVKVSRVLGADGKRNAGIFAVKALTGGGSYIVKALHSTSREFEGLEAFNKKEVVENPSAENFPAYPSFAPLLASAKLSQLQVGLFAAAPGKSISALHRQWAADSSSLDLTAMYRSLGASMGSLHFARAKTAPKALAKQKDASISTWIHGDANPSNVFFDGTKVTFIDNADVARDSGLSGVERDIGFILPDIVSTAKAAGAARKQQKLAGAGDAITPVEQRLRVELAGFFAFAGAYLKYSDANVRKWLVPGIFGEKLKEYFGAYAEASTEAASVVLERVPQFQLVVGEKGD